MVVLSIFQRQQVSQDSIFKVISLIEVQIQHVEHLVLSGTDYYDMEKQGKVDMHLRSVKIIAKTVYLSLKTLKRTWSDFEYEFANIKVLKSL